MLEKHFKSQQYYTNEFYQACMNGDFELAVCLLKMGVNLNVKFEHGQNLLHIACTKNFYGLVQLLIKFGCNEFLKDNYGRTALHYAALNNSASIVRYLVEKNTFANNNNTDLLTKEFLNCQDIDGKTAIHLASENNHKEPIMIILSSGLADMNLEDHSNQNALTISYTKKYWEIFEMLIKSGSNISNYILKDICVQGDQTALNILLRYFDSKSLASMIDLNESGDKKNSYLYLAIKYSLNLDFITKLFDMGLKINSRDLKDFYSELKHFAKNNTFLMQMNLSRFSYYLECVILLIKFNCFNTSLIKYPNILIMFNSLESKSDINFDQKTNIINHIIILYLNLIYDFYSNMLVQQEKQKKSECLSENDHLNLKTRLYYLFALAVYSSQLDTSKKFVQKWFEKKFLCSSSSSSKSSSNHHHKKQKEKEKEKETEANKSHPQDKLKLNDIYRESINSPWSLQMLCRCTIKSELNNIDYVLNDKSLIKGLKLPNICVRYLKYEFI